MYADTLSLNIGLLLGRLVIGLVMAAHGAQKLFGWFGGYGLNKTGEFFAYLGFQRGKAFAAAASLTEITSGLLVALGLLGPVGPALIVSVMLVAIVTVHWEHGLFASNNGIEVPLLYVTGAVALALVGFGRYSVDALLGLDALWSPALTWLALAAGALGAGANLTLRRPPAPTARA